MSSYQTLITHSVGEVDWVLRTYQGEFHPSLGAFHTSAQERQHDAGGIKCVDQGV